MNNSNNRSNSSSSSSSSSSNKHLIESEIHIYNTRKLYFYF